MEYIIAKLLSNKMDVCNEELKKSFILCLLFASAFSALCFALVNSLTDAISLYLDSVGFSKMVCMSAKVGFIFCLTLAFILWLKSYFKLFYNAKNTSSEGVLTGITSTMNTCVKEYIKGYTSRK